MTLCAVFCRFLQRWLTRLQEAFNQLREGCRLYRLEKIITLQSLWRRYDAAKYVRQLRAAKKARHDAARKIQVRFWNFMGPHQPVCSVFALSSLSVRGCCSCPQRAYNDKQVWEQSLHLRNKVKAIYLVRAVLTIACL